MRRIKVWVEVGETTRRLSALFCFHLVFSVHSHGNFCQCCSGSEILGEILKGSLLTAHCFLFFCFYKASKGLHRSSFFPGCENRERGGRTFSRNATGLGWLHMAGKENSDSLPHSVIHHVFIECDIWPEFCICVWDKRTVMGLWKSLVQEGSLMSKPQNTVHAKSCTTGLCAQGTEHGRRFLIPPGEVVGKRQSRADSGTEI